MLIDWAASADDDLTKILAYFARQGDAATGEWIVGRLIRSVGILADQPLAGKSGRINGTRELIPRKLPYVLVYQISSPEIVEVVRVLHTSRLFPETLWEEEDKFL